MSSDSFDWRAFEIEQSGSAGGHCDCCGTATRRVWGFAHRGDETAAAYFVSWTEGKPDHGATFDLILGRWGESTGSNDRYVVALDLRLLDQTPQFAIVDANNRVHSSATLAEKELMRSDVIGTPLAAQVFAIVDAIYMSTGAREVRAWSES